MPPAKWWPFSLGLKVLNVFPPNPSELMMFISMLRSWNRDWHIDSYCDLKLWGPKHTFYTYFFLRPRQNGRHFPDDIFKCIFFNENAWISIKISLKFVLKGPVNKIPALVQIKAWRRQATSHYLNQWWLVYWRIYASLGFNELTVALYAFCIRYRLRYPNLWTDIHQTPMYMFKWLHHCKTVWYNQSLMPQLMRM